jgi:hypothetical protein
VFALVWLDPVSVAQRETTQRYEALRESDRLQMERERHALELERMAQAHAVSLWVAPVLQVGTAVVGLVLLIYVARLPGLVESALTRVFQRRADLVWPDAAGRLPQSLASASLEYDRVAAASLAGYHATEHERARQSYAVPHSYSYAPHIRVAPGHAARAVDETPAESPSLSGVPSFADLLQQGRVGRGQPLLLGFDKGTALDGVWLDVYSSALAGMPNSGKTTSQRFMACQLALWGARFVVCDPHMGAGDDSLAATLHPLRATFLCEPADDPGAILESIRYVDSIGDARIHGRDDSRTPVILWLDELNGLLADSAVGPGLARLLRETTRQYRKVGVYISAVAHTWSASSTGGSSDLRANFASRFCHRMERSQARLLLPTDMAAKVERLEPGQAVLHSMRFSTIIQVPLTTAADVDQVAGLLTADVPVMERAVGGYQDGYKVQPQPTPVVADVKPDCSHSVANQGRLQSAAVSAEAARVAALFRAGEDLPGIVHQVRGIRSDEGGRYQKAYKEIQQLLREGMNA